MCELASELELCPKLRQVSVTEINRPVNLSRSILNFICHLYSSQQHIQKHTLETKSPTLKLISERFQYRKQKVKKERCESNGQDFKKVLDSVKNNRSWHLTSSVMFLNNKDKQAQITYAC